MEDRGLGFFFLERAELVREIVFYRTYWLASSDFVKDFVVKPIKERDNVRLFITDDSMIPIITAV